MSIGEDGVWECTMSVKVQTGQTDPQPAHPTTSIPLRRPRIPYGTEFSVSRIRVDSSGSTRDLFLNRKPPSTLSTSDWTPLFFSPLVLVTPPPPVSATIPVPLR